jgi:hypothetical protein
MYLFMLTFLLIVGLLIRMLNRDGFGDGKQQKFAGERKDCSTQIFLAGF